MVDLFDQVLAANESVFQANGRKVSDRQVSILLDCFFCIENFIFEDKIFYFKIKNAILPRFPKILKRKKSANFLDFVFFRFSLIKCFNISKDQVKLNFLIQKRNFTDKIFKNIANFLDQNLPINT